MSAERIVTIPIESGPGFTKVRIASLDERIFIDDFYPAHPEALWYCDNCEAGQPVTAQFKTGTSEDGEDTHITLCATCLQNALNGIAHSLTNPKDFDADGAA